MQYERSLKILCAEAVVSRHSRTMRRRRGNNSVLKHHEPFFLPDHDVGNEIGDLSDFGRMHLTRGQVSALAEALKPPCEALSQRRDACKHTRRKSTSSLVCGERESHQKSVTKMADANSLLAACDDTKPVKELAVELCAMRLTRNQQRNLAVALKVPEKKTSLELPTKHDRSLLCRPAENRSTVAAHAENVANEDLTADQQPVITVSAKQKKRSKPNKALNAGVVAECSNNLAEHKAKKPALSVLSFDSHKPVDPNLASNTGNKRIKGVEKTDHHAAQVKIVSRRSVFLMPPDAAVKSDVKYPACNALGRRHCSFDADAIRMDDEHRTETTSTVQCTKCQKFVHICCLNKAYGTQFERQAQFDRYEQLFCPRCCPPNNATDDGASRTLHAKIYARPTNSHRQNAWEENAGSAIQIASPDFVAKIVATNFPDARTCADNVMLHMRGRDVQMDFLEKYGFRVPILIAEPCGLSVTVPETNPEKTRTPFTYDTVLELCGRSRRVDCIDSRAQVHYNIELGSFVDYMMGRQLRQQKLDHAILLNVVSLEFSDVAAMKALYEPPAIVREMSWASSVMPAEKKRIVICSSSQSSSSSKANEQQNSQRDLQHNFDYDYDYSVEYFCLMGAAGSFTDFHIDFGGSCVFYHIMRGKKVFYLAPPTADNMKLYRKYEASENKTMFVDGSDNFFKLMEAAGLPIYRLELVPGNTVLLPAGWIHSVHTPEDSLVFGGNFLNHLCIPTQLQAYAIEEELKYPHSDRYHNFEINCVYAIDDLVYKLRLQEKMKISLEKKKKCSRNDAKLGGACCFKQYQVHGLRRLVDFVESLWLKSNRLDDFRNDKRTTKKERRSGTKRRLSAGSVADDGDNDDGGDHHEESLDNIVRRAKRLLDRLERQYGVDSNQEPKFENIPFAEYRIIMCDDVVVVDDDRAAEVCTPTLPPPSHLLAALQLQQTNAAASIMPTTALTQTTKIAARRRKQHQKPHDFTLSGEVFVEGGNNSRDIKRKNAAV